MSELIAAVATPPGTGGVGILRLSGPGAGQPQDAHTPRPRRGGHGGDEFRHGSLLSGGKNFGESTVKIFLDRQV